ncbi:response regulator, partial [Myxococcota bacterium]|nr:response regulator [Myxococcota bacterium]
YAEPHPGDARRILVVEDEDYILQVVVRLLQRLGYEVLTASSPQGAMEIIEEHRGTIDLVITDLVMPGMNGRELADQMGKRAPDLRFLFMSAYTPDIIRSSGLLDERMCFIQKPFTLDTLKEKVREALDLECS